MLSSLSCSNFLLSCRRVEDLTLDLRGDFSGGCVLAAISCAVDSNTVTKSRSEVVLARGRVTLSSGVSFGVPAGVS